MTDLIKPTDGAEDTNQLDIKPSEEDVSKVDEGAKKSIANQDAVADSRKGYEVDELKRLLDQQDESKENQTIGPIYMVFRENDNWDKYAPKIMKHIKQLGGQIEIKSFPRGTEKEKIKEWYEHNQDTFSEKFLLTDTTCEPTIEKDQFQGEFNLDDMLTHIDRKLMAKLTKEILYNDDDEFTKYAKMFKLALQTNFPKRVTLLINKASHHFGSTAKSQSREADEEVANFFKECLLKAGYPEANISMVDNITVHSEEMAEFKEYLLKAGYPEVILSMADKVNLKTNTIQMIKKYIKPEDQKAIDFFKMFSTNDGYPEAIFSMENTITIKPEDVETMKDEWFMIDSHNKSLYEIRKLGLTCFEPGFSTEIIIPKNDEVEQDLLSEIDHCFKKTRSPE